MFAMCSRRFGVPPTWESVPAAPLRQGEVRVRLVASSVGAGDALMAAGEPWLFRPIFALLMGRERVLGRDVAGIIDEIGPGVTGWKVGDRVIGEAGRAWASWVNVPVDALARVPDGVSLRTAALLPVAGITALQGLRRGEVGPGRRVLIHGASGGVGHLAVGIASLLGAEVTAVCSAAKADAVRELGANEVLDYRTEHFTDRRAAWDVVFDLAGTTGVSAALATLRPGGTYVSSVGRGGGRLLGVLPTLIARGLRGLFDRRLQVLTTSCNTADLAQLLQWTAEGRLRPHEHDALPLQRAPEALARLDAGEVTGRIVLQAPSASCG